MCRCRDNLCLCTSLSLPQKDDGNTTPCLSSSLYVVYPQPVPLDKKRTFHPEPLLFRVMEQVPLPALATRLSLRTPAKKNPHTIVSIPSVSASSSVLCVDGDYGGGAGIGVVRRSGLDWITYSVFRHVYEREGLTFIHRYGAVFRVS